MMIMITTMLLMIIITTTTTTTTTITTTTITTNLRCIQNGGVLTEDHYQRVTDDDAGSGYKHPRGDGLMEYITGEEEVADELDTL
jgi:hypothetical protein